MFRVAVVTVLVLAISGADGFTGDAFNGINLPQRQGTSNSGAFLDGIYKLDYSASFLATVKSNGFNFLRIPVNLDTVRDGASLHTIARYFEQVDNNGIICFFDTKKDNEESHGDGKPDDLDQVGKCWAITPCDGAECAPYRVGGGGGGTDSKGRCPADEFDSVGVGRWKSAISTWHGLANSVRVESGDYRPRTPKGDGQYGVQRDTCPAVAYSRRRIAALYLRGAQVERIVLSTGKLCSAVGQGATTYLLTRNCRGDR